MNQRERNELFGRSVENNDRSSRMMQRLSLSLGCELMFEILDADSHLNIDCKHVAMFIDIDRV